MKGMSGVEAEKGGRDETADYQWHIGKGKIESNMHSSNILL